MTLRTKLEITAVVVFVWGMMAYGVSCEPGHCVEALRYWLVEWWIGTGLFALYFLWTRLD